VSVAAPPPTAAPGASPAPPPVDAACPLCGAPLNPDQEWCLSCGAAARTRLAAPTNWRGPIAAIAVLATLALGVLAAALVKLSDGPGTATTPAAITITTTTPAVTTPLGAIPTTTGPTGVTGLGGTAVPTNTGAVTPGTPTTIAPGPTTTTTGAPGAPGAPGASTPTATATTPATTTTGAGTSPAIAEERLRKAGFLPRTKK
jgi:hypothetical protein